ncbi:MAG: DUF4388 domain-containing protein [Blastocatellia bacterium]
MELTGQLSDFPLTDILHILSISGKTCTVILRSDQGQRGMLVFIRGKIVQASTDAILYSLGEIFVQNGIITEEDLEEALEIQSSMDKPRLIGSILVEKGKVSREYLQKAIKQQIQDSVAELLSWKRGTFEIKLNAIPIGRGLPYITQDYVYTEGLNIGELVQEATKLLDERRRDGTFIEVKKIITSPTSSEDLLKELDDYMEPSRARDDTDSINSVEKAILHLKYLLEELKQQSFHGEVTLLVMRLASEVCSRGVLFLVKDDEAQSLGQFGLSVDSVSADNSIVFDLSLPSLLNRVVRNCKTQIAALDLNTYDREILKQMGGENLNLTGFGIPLVVEDKVRVILYGDNYPGDRGLGSLDELEILISQAGLMMEKMLLEQKLSNTKA